MKKLSFMIVTAFLLAACGSRALAPGAAPTPTPAPSPVSAQGETDGVTLRLDLERSSLRPGEVVWATVTVENTNVRAIHWMGGGCNIPGSVTVGLPAARDQGRDWPEPALADFKRRLLLGATGAGAQFLNEAAWALRDRGGQVCTADLRAVELAPGGKLVTRFAWDGMVSPGTPAPAGTTTVTAKLGLTDMRFSFQKEVSATVQITIVGGSTATISAGQAIDAAYDDGRLASWVRARAGATPRPGVPEASGIDGSVRLNGDEWVIQAMDRSGGSMSTIAVRIGANDRAVRGVVQR